MTDLWLSRVFVQALNIPKLLFCGGSAPDPGEEFTTLLQTSRPPSQLGRGCPHTLPSSTPSAFDLGAFGASLVRFPTQIPGYAHDVWWLMFAFISGQMALASSLSSHFGPHLSLLFQLH